ncbi:MAG: hypothetical protein GY810_03910 [Aureispira sp.]|nr:hypothetical protein [Aureispira sp.]
MFSLFGPPKKIPVDAIKKGKYLDLAKELNVTQFFKTRMKNRMRKTLVGSWHILLETDSMVYLAYPTPKKGFSSKKIVQHHHFFKTDKQELVKQFSQYKTLQGYQLKELLRDKLNYHFRQKYAPLNPIIELRRWKAILEKNIISSWVEVFIKIKEGAPIEETYKLSFTNKELELIEIEKLPNDSISWIEYNK